MLKEENVFDTQMNRVSGQKNPYDLESPSQAKAREKKERNLATLALIGDGIQAITKAVAASQGGKVNTNTPSMSKTYLERLEAQKAKRERQREKYNAYEERRNDTLGNLSIAKYRDARQRKKEAADADWRQKNYDFEVQKYNEGKEYRDRQAKEQADSRKQSNALGWANYNLAKERNEEGLTVYDSDGKPHKFRDKEAAKHHALQWGTYKLNTRKIMKPYQDEFGAIKYKEEEEVVDGWYSVPKAKPTPQAKPEFKEAPQAKNGARYQVYGLPGMSLGTTPISFNPNDEEEIIEYK